MTKTATRIATIADTLSPEAQQALLEVAETLAKPLSFYESMTAAQLAELDQAIAEAAPIIGRPAGDEAADDDESPDHEHARAQDGPP